MFAIIETGGKQYKVAADDILEIEKLPAEEAATVIFDRVLMLQADDGLKIGQPLVDGATVTAEIVNHYQGDKVIVFKKKRRQTYKRKRGHRQLLTTVRILGIHPTGVAAAAA